MSVNDEATGRRNAATYDSAFLKACRREPVPHTPVWFMRQAGRSLPEYRKIREGVPMLESCMRPELVVEITMQPVRRYGVDAAIFFSDIVLPLKAVGVDLDIKPGIGPVVASPVRTLEDVAAIPDLTPEHVDFVTEAVRTLTGELGATPLIGFAALGLMLPLLAYASWHAADTGRFGLTRMIGGTWFQLSTVRPSTDTMRSPTLKPASRAGLGPVSRRLRLPTVRLGLS